VRVRGIPQVGFFFLLFDESVEESFTGLLFGSNLFGKRKRGHFPTEEEREEQDKHLFVYCYNQGGESSRRDMLQISWRDYNGF